MKKILCTLLLITLLSSLFPAVGFAADGDILNRDFEDGSVSGINKSATVSIADGKAEDGGKCLSFGNVNDVARFMFSADKSVVVSSGTLCVEFDVKEGFGGIGMGVFTSSDTNYGNYSKAPFSSGTRNSTPARGLKAYTTTEGQHPAGNAGSKTYIKGYRASGASSDMAITANKWQHVLLEIDFDNACTYLTLDDVKSEAVTGFTYLSDIVGIGFKWAPSGISADASDDLKEALIDNLRVYMAPPKVSKVGIIKTNGKENADLTKVSPKTNTIRVAFSEAMSADSVSGAVSLYDVTNAQNIGLSLSDTSEDGKIFNFAVDGLAENTGYKVTVGACESERGLFTEEYEMSFSTTDLISAERISYYSNDFEDSEVGGKPKNVLGQTDTTQNFAVVKEENGNKYMVTSTRSRFLFNESITSGVIVVDADISIIKSGTVGFGIVYTASPASYSKWPIGFNASGKGMYYDATGSNPPSILQGHTFDLLKENPTEQMTLAQEKWQNLKIYLDTDYNKITVEIDGVKSAETKEIPFISGKNGIGGIVFYTSNLADTSLDNVNVYRAENGVYKTEILDSDGNILTGEKISPSAQSIKVTFSEKITSEPEILLECNGADENFTKTWDGLGRCVTLTPEKGYFESASSYAVKVNAGYSDSFDRICETDYEYLFETDEGGMNILGIFLKKDGKKIESASEISSGSAVTVSADYVLTRPEKKIENAVLAVVFEKDGKLTHIAKKTVNLDKTGGNSAQFDAAIPDGCEFDTANVYLWNLAPRTVISPFASYTK